jgi:hypothetical protein
MVDRRLRLLSHILCAACVWAAQTAPQPVATDLRLKAPGAALYANISGTSKKIAGAALKAWLIDSGREVLYSAADGAGGYENEGQALHVYDVSSGTQKKVLSEYFMITGVDEVKTVEGKTALLVKMRGGGLGASSISVVDPGRGEVLFVASARIASRNGNSLTVGLYQNEDWEKLQSNEKVRPYKTARYDLDEVLHRPVIVNKRSPVN